VPAWRTIPATRPALAPLAFARETTPQPAATPAPVVPALTRMPAPSVANLVLAPAPVDAAVGQMPATVDTLPGPATTAAPRPVRSVAPAYPPQALLNGVQGVLGGPRWAAWGLSDAAARWALTHWRFAPPAATGSRYRQTFTFQLGGTLDGDASAAQACLVRTGTHICRPVLEGATGIATPHLGH